MKETFNDINDQSSKLKTARYQLFQSQNKLSCILRLLQNLISLLDMPAKVKEVLIATFTSCVQDLEQQVDNSETFPFC